MKSDEFLKEKHKILKSMPDTVCLTREEAKFIISELEKYRAIGTVEECQKAREKQQAKKVNNRTLLRDLNGDPYAVRGDCPNCGNVNLVSNANYCNACGQKLDWSE